jgi:hypothetical protein
MNAEAKLKRPRILRVFAWIAVSLLLLGWVCLPFVFRGGSGDLLSYIFLSSHFGAFVIGLSSFGRLGGIAAGLAALTLTAWLTWESGFSAAG